MIDLSPIDKAIRPLMVTAAETLILPRFRRLTDDDIQEKSHANDLVTIADIEAEARLAPQLEALIPSSRALGEEATSRGEVSPQILSDSAPVWTIDPVDGTYNFVHGREDFCSMIALVQGGQVLGGWIYFPTRNLFYTALKGQGAWRTEHGQPPQRLSIGQGETGGLAKKSAIISQRFWKQPHLRADRQQILDQLGPVEATTCAGLTYAQIADGTAAFAAMASLTPWDHAPGTLIVSESGGQVRLRGGAYDPTVTVGPLICGAASKRRDLAEQMLS